MRRWVAPGLPVLVTAVVGAVWQALVDTPDPQSDAFLYHVLGSALAGQTQDPYYSLGFAIDGMAVRGWTFPSWIALVYAMLGEPKPGAVAWTQAIVLLPLTTFLVYVAGKVAFSRAVGLAAAWGFALWFPLVYHTTWLLTETTLGVVSTLLLALLAAVVVRRRTGLAVALGIALGLVTLTHAAWQFLPLLLVLALVAHFLAHDRSSLRLAGWAAAGALVVLGPYHLAAAIGDLPKQGQGGLGFGSGGAWGFYVGSRRDTDFIRVPNDVLLVKTPAGELAVGVLAGTFVVDGPMREIILERAGKDPASFLSDSDYYRAGVGNLLSDPAGWPRKIERGGAVLFIPPGGELGPYPSPTPSATWYQRPWHLLGYPLVALMLGGTVLVAAGRRDRVVLFAPLVVQTVAFMSGTPEPRYAYPLLSAVFVLSGIAVVTIARTGSRAWAARRLQLQDCG